MNNYNIARLALEGSFSMWLMPFLLILVLWSLFWKGLALWHSARAGKFAWFTVLLVINTIGILEIIYLFGVLKIEAKDLFKK